MNRTNQFVDKILQNFDKVSDDEKKKVFQLISSLEAGTILHTDILINMRSTATPVHVKF